MSNCSHAEYLFKVPQCWLVPSYMIDNTQYATVIGRRSTGNALVDRMIQTEMVMCTAFLEEYAMVFGEGHRMGPIDVDTGVKAYYHLTGHLIDWATYLSSPKLMDRNIPIEGLRQFSLLAEGVFKVAKEKGYDRQLEVRKSLWSSISGRRLTKKPGNNMIYNDAMIKSIEEAYRRRRNMGMLGELGGSKLEKGRI